MKRREITKGDILIILMIVISTAVFVFSLMALLRYYRSYRQESVLEQELDAIRQKNGSNDASEEHEKSTDSAADKEESTGRKDFYELLALNGDYVLWLSIPDTDISYPVVQRDNSYYLHHNFIQESSSHGTLFLDENCQKDGDVFLIHGHHMKDGTMFGGLKKFRKQSYIQEHTSLYLDFGNGDEEYRIFAVALIDLDSETHFKYYELFKDKKERSVYMDGLKKAAFYYDIDAVETEDADKKPLAVLSTCEYGTNNQRLIAAYIKK